MIGIYCEPSWNVLGGSQFLVAVLAEALAKRFKTELIVPSSFDVRSVEAFAGVDLRGVAIRPFKPGSPIASGSRLPWARYGAAKQALRELSEPYELFINITHGLPPFSHAHAGILLVLFPMFRPNFSARASGRSSPIDLAKDAYRSLELQRRMSSYDTVIAISEFTREWLKRWWRVNAVVIYPPVDTSVSVGSKDDLIVSVGRFSPRGHCKKQLEMVAAFKELCGAGMVGWRYETIGAVSEALDDARYFEQVVNAAPRDVRVVSNASRPDVLARYGRSKIFWHAAGLGESEATRPELMEHFGISTVEAMAAGCVPIVINRGGQPEIVEHGVSGFLFETTQELATYTRQLVENPQLLRTMSDAARSRAQRFAREVFTKAMHELTVQLLNAVAVPDELTAGLSGGVRAQ